MDTVLKQPPNANQSFSPLSPHSPHSPPFTSPSFSPLRGLNSACLTWGKAGQGSANRHSALPAHLLAVAATFEALLELPLAHKALCAAWGVQTLPSLSLLIWCAALHDLGKAHPKFQRKRMDILRWIAAFRNEDDPCESAEADNFDHGIEGGQRLWHLVEAALKTEGYFPGHEWSRPAMRTLRGLLLAGFAHHGHHGAPTDITKDGVMNAKDAVALSKGLAEVLFSLHGQFVAPSYPVQPVVVAQLFAGWVTLADWIGSDERIFPFIDCVRFAEEHPSPADWARLYPGLLASARMRLKALGLANQADTSQWHALVMQSFSMNTVQMASQKVARELVGEGGGGGLMIIEAPMGCGKTEAALLVAGTFIDAKKAQGVAFGLPAQASANMIVRRMQDLSLKAYGCQPNLAHANASFVRHRMQESMFSSGKEIEAATLLDTWLTEHNKRAFLAPMCAATVDQMELAAMHSKHGFVRLVALSRQVVIIDEVHAYDAYMRRIVRVLLQCLGAAQVPTVLLSATLPTAMRAAMTDAYALGAGWSTSGPDRLWVSELLQSPETGNEAAAASNSSKLPYPVITSLGPQGGLQQTAVAWNQPPRKVRIVRYDDTIWLRRTLEAAAQGKCAAILCNTVRSARDRFRAIRRLDKSAKVTLLHSRLRNEDRTLRQEFIETLAGRGSSAAGRAGQIIVATQVLEQSIDIDVDYMLSEPAPIDLLLQRMGRLHRHERTERTWEPVFGIIDPQNLDPKTGPRWWRSSIRRVYAEGGKLLKSLELVLSIANGSSPIILLPEQIPSLVSAVYGDGQEIEMTNEEALKEKFAEDVVLDLTYPMDQVGRNGIQSNATRYIEDEIKQVLLVTVDAQTGKWSIPTAVLDDLLPEMLSIDGKRVNVGFLGEAQRWQLPVRMNTGTDDPDNMFTKTVEFTRALKESEAEEWRLPFIVVPVKVAMRQGGRLRLSIGVTPTGQNLYYDNEEGLINA